MALLCEFHHGLRHHGGWRMRLDPDGTVTVTSPDGGIVRTETAAQARARHGVPATCKDTPPGVATETRGVYRAHGPTTGGPHVGRAPPPAAARPAGTATTPFPEATVGG